MSSLTPWRCHWVSEWHHLQFVLGTQTSITNSSVLNSPRVHSYRNNIGTFCVSSLLQVISWVASSSACVKLFCYAQEAWNFCHNATPLTSWCQNKRGILSICAIALLIQAIAAFPSGLEPGFPLKPDKVCYCSAGECLHWRHNGNKWDILFLRPSSSEHVPGTEWLRQTCGSKRTKMKGQG